jgi:uncharacterized phage protein (TIGR01671 family)
MENSRFKFRVFDKETGKYYKSRINKCSGRTLYQHPSSGHCQWVTISTLFAKLEQDEKIYTRTGVEPDTIIEQCTGLKDKNGKLIYEGDIVIGRKEIVVCELKEYKDVVKYKDGAYFPFNWTGIYNPEKFEIIGNIHEQAEQKDVK